MAIAIPTPKHSLENVQVVGVIVPSLLDYGALIGEHGRLVHRRWILGKPVAENPLLAAPELGPVADTVALYEAVEKNSPLPVGKRTVMIVLLPIILPMLLLVAQRVPIGDVLVKLLKTGSDLAGFPLTEAP